MVTLRALVLLLTLCAPELAWAFVLGGGIPTKDCRLAFGGVDATDGASQVVCIDGDACDADGVADGSCRFAVSLCVGVAVPDCSPSELTSLDVHGLPLDPPPLPSVAGTCGATSQITLPVLDEAGVTAVARDGRALKDVDYLNLCCVPGASPILSVICAAGVSLEVAGCPAGALPSGAVAAFERARGFVQQLLTFPVPSQERLLARKAIQELKKVRRAAKRLAIRQPCGNTLGLIATHALETVRARVVSLPPGPRQAPSP